MPLIETKGAASSQAYGQFARQVAANYIEDVFSAYLYTGNSFGSTTQTITNGIDLSTKGGLVWIKSRSNAVDHNLYDTTRGVKNFLASNSTTQASSWFDGGVSAFNTTGFTVGPQTSNSNVLNQNYVSWTFRKQAKFFDIVTYTGDGSSSRLINHSLGSVPGLVIIKSTTQPTNWPVMFAPATGNAIGFSNALSGGGLNSTAAGYSLGAVSGVSTATQFRVGSSYWGAGSETNDSGSTYIAYVFASNAGGFGAAGTDNVISCGSFTTDGSGNATVTLGWEPQWIMRKSSSSAATGWEIGDNMRGMPAPPTDGPFLRADSSLDEASLGLRAFGPTATGFIATGSPSTTYIYMAIRRGPMRTPTSGTSVFLPALRNGTGAAATVTGVGFPPDAVFVNVRGSGTRAFVDRMRGAKVSLCPADSSAEKTSPATKDISAFDQNGISFAGASDQYSSNTSGQSYVNWFFRRAPGFFDVMCYAGTSGAQTLNHNLGVVPALIISKSRTGTSTDGWFVFFNFGAALYRYLYLHREDSDLSPILYSSNYYFNAKPTSTSLSLGSVNWEPNVSGTSYVSYLFASCPGVSKVGNYTGTGAAQTIDCGFTGGARFVLIKRTSGANASWYIWDSARGIISGDDPYILLNSFGAEVTNTDYLSVQSSGFGLTATAPAELNANGSTYLFLAIA